MTPSEEQVALLLALALDVLFGEPPNALHPVAWLGNLVSVLERRAPRDQPRRELLYGAALAIASVAAAVTPALVLEVVSRSASVLGSRSGSRWLLLGSALLLKPAFAGRALFQATEAVRRPLSARDIDSARQALRSLVSRDPTELDMGQIAAAAIESLAENASDSFVAPLFYYGLFGLPGAWAYRAVNTLDAMVGYHGRYEFLGKIPARLDDALNIIPARLTALLIVAAAGMTRADAPQAWAILRRDHARTESPNAGHPISAMAGALGVRLEKVGHYQLNELGRDPQADDIGAAARVVGVALALAALGALLARRGEGNL